MGCPSMNLGISGHARGLQEAKGNQLIPEWYRTGNFFGGKNIKRSKKTRSKRKRRRSYKKVSGGFILSGSDNSIMLNRYLSVDLS